MSYQKFKECMDACLECAVLCENCATACLKEEGVQQMTACILLDRDCADICFLTAQLLARGSKHGEHLMGECAEVCEACGQECGKHKMDHCQQCAEACKKCAEMCRSMVEA